MCSAEDGAYRVLTECAHGFMVSQVVFAACELGVFDVLAEAPGPLDLGTVAMRLGTSTHGTELLLDACVSLKLLMVETRSGKAFYGNTELSSTYLTSLSPRSQCHMLLYMARTTYRCWGHLAEAVRQGKNQYQKAFGIPSHDLFTAIYRSEGERLQFMRGLQEVWSISGRSVMTAFDLSPFPLICDLGGGSGALAKECTSLYPDAEVTVFDVPEVVRVARTHFPFAEEGRISFQEGDFFQDRLPEADLYILARVLHDWTDAKCSALLARIHRACRPGGGILVVESLLDEDRRGPRTTLLFSLNMLLQTEGRERTPAQYHALVSAAGFGDFQFKKTGSVYDAMLVRKSLPLGSGATLPAGELAAFRQTLKKKLSGSGTLSSRTLGKESICARTARLMQEGFPNRSCEDLPLEPPQVTSEASRAPSSSPPSQPSTRRQQGGFRASPRVAASLGARPCITTEPPEVGSSRLLGPLSTPEGGAESQAEQVRGSRALVAMRSRMIGDRAASSRTVRNCFSFCIYVSTTSVSVSVSVSRVNMEMSRRIPVSHKELEGLLLCGAPTPTATKPQQNANFQQLKNSLPPKKVFVKATFYPTSPAISEALSLVVAAPEDGSIPGSRGWLFSITLGTPHRDLRTAVLVSSAKSTIGREW
ncbi:acetylserotonin O-methyltransferase [Erethizon dorsatum]